jgi:uncharacterized protein (TIGR02996 family)
MTEHGTFLQEILSHPDDDAPRLIYADWLEERGDPRGEFIRVQCALTTLPKMDARRPDMEERQRQLLAEHQTKWLATLNPECLAPSRPFIPFERGFLGSRVSTSPTHYLRYTDLWSCWAIRQDLELWRRLNDEEPPAEVADYARMATSPLLERWVSLHFPEQELDPDCFQALITSPGLTRLRELDVFETPIGAEGVRALTSTPHLTELTKLYLNTIEGGDGGAEALAASPHLGSLATLGYLANGMTDQGAAALANSPHLVNLRVLDLNGNPIGDAGAAALAESRYLNCLDELYLHGTNISERGEERLVSRFGNEVQVSRITPDTDSE